MIRNARKCQILEILAKNPLTIEEIADDTGIDKHNALVYCLRYQKQGLLERAGDRYALTKRGLDRMVFLSN